MAGAAAGDVLLLGALLAVVAVDLLAGAGVALAAASVLVRWGSSSLGALAGDQAVIGAAGWTGPIALVLSSWCAAVAIVIATPRGVLPALAFGLAAASVVAGPGVGGPVVVRIVASAVAVAAAWAVGRYATPSWTRLAAGLLGLLALGLAFAR
jgi:hypothetical protein